MKKISRKQFLKGLLGIASISITTSALASQWSVDENGQYTDLSQGDFYGNKPQPTQSQNDIIYDDNFYPDAPYEDEGSGRYVYDPEADGQIRPRTTRTEISWSGGEAPGTIIVSTKDRKLWHITGPNTAVQYQVAVGKEGFAWSGTEKITSKREWPTWTPTAEMRKRNPRLPVQVAGGPQNPMGARALYLGSTLYRIHGSNEPETIGKAVSSGCIRMTNEDVIDLYNSTNVGATVTVKH